MIIDIIGLCESSLIGKIKNITESVNSEISFSRSFHENGYETERRFYKNAEVECVFKLFPDAKGWRVDKVSFNSYAGTETIFKFNKDRKLIYHYGKYIDYNESGDIAKETRYYKSGNLEEVITYRYFECGKEIQTYHYRDNGSVSYFEKTIEKYFDKNKISSIENFNSDGMLVEEMAYCYDSDGKLIQETTFENGVITEESIYNYDDNGHCVYERHIDEKYGDCTEFFFKYKLDKLGRVVTKNAVGKDGKIIIKTFYEYDQVGNTVKEIETTGSLKYGLSNFRTFEIEYH